MKVFARFASQFEVFKQFLRLALLTVGSSLKYGESST